MSYSGRFILQCNNGHIKIVDAYSELAMHFSIKDFYGYDSSEIGLVNICNLFKKNITKCLAPKCNSHYHYVDIINDNQLTTTISQCKTIITEKEKAVFDKNGDLIREAIYKCEKSNEYISFDEVYKKRFGTHQFYKRRKLWILKWISSLKSLLKIS